mgnify:CR=1 FL=1
MNETLKVLKERRSVRKYKAEQIRDEELNAILEAGTWAPSAKGLQTSVMVVGFVNSGMMKVRQAIGIVLGANIGTSVTGWILCLSYISSSDALSLLSSATITAIAAIAGIVLNAILPGKDYEFVQEDKGSTSVDFKV